MSRRYSLDGAVVTGVPAEFALYPFGVFTTFVAVGGSVLGWREHLARLARDALALWGHELDEARVRSLVRCHLASLEGASTVRVSIYPEGFSLDSPALARGCRILISSGSVDFPFAPQSDFAVCTIEYERELAEMKSTGIFSQIRLRREAQLAGYDDVLFRCGDDVLEGASWTVLCWRNGEVITPTGSVLRSITAGQLERLAEEMGWRSDRRPLGRAELVQADLVVAVNANFPARAIRSVDGELLPVDQELLGAIAGAYSALPREVVADAPRGMTSVGVEDL